MSGIALAGSGHVVYTFTMRTHHRRGQSLIEYSFIVLLVILGIVIMGPYVLRSINAHFKIWDEEVQDSHNERIVDPGASGVPGN